MTNTLELQVLHTDGRIGKIDFVVENIYNGGYAGRDQTRVREHIEELALIGVPVPANIPTLYPLANNNLATADAIQVQNKETSGEIEYVILQQAGVLPESSPWKSGKGVI